MTMRFRDLLAEHATVFSFEFFPVKSDEAAKRIFARAEELGRLKPSFVSVTYGAGGSTRERTRDLVVRLREQLGLNAVPHLTCVDHTRQDLIDILQSYHDHHVQNIVAIRGDAPHGQGRYQPLPDGLGHGNELVELIKTRFADLGVAVAGYPEGHPETVSKLDDLENLKRKVEAGADCVITQLFFDNRDFYDFRDRCELIGIKVPIIAGIMPISSWRGIQRMSALCGARIPAPLMRQLERAGENNEIVEEIGTRWATEQCRDLLDNGVRGIHFYTLNRSEATLSIYRRLGAADSTALRQYASPHQPDS